jgi:hypothetical protein
LNGTRVLRKNPHFWLWLGVVVALCAALRRKVNQFMDQPQGGRMFFSGAGMLLWALLCGLANAQVTGAVVYRCPGPPVLYTDAITPAEAKDRACRTIEGTPITVIQAPPKARPAAQVAAATTTASTPRANGETKIDAAAQKVRDSDAKRILEAELKREEERLAGLMKDFNNGEPERRGDERNFQKYQERVAEMKSAIGRVEANVVALKRELLKHP